MWARLYTSPALQRLLSDKLAVALGVLRGHLWWHMYPAWRRRRALGSMAGLLDESPRSDRVRDAARQHLVESSVDRVISWRPRMYDSATIDGLENLDRAVALGRGVVLLSAHIGPFSIRSLLARGYRVHVVVGEAGLYREPYVGHTGLRHLAIKHRVEEAGGRTIVPPNAFAVCRSALESGEICAISFDMPGDHQTRFGSRCVGVRTGAARLALATGAPVVPGFAGRRGHRVTGRLEEPIDPHACGGLDELVAHLARRVAAEMTARPGECELTQFLRRLPAARQSPRVPGVPSGDLPS